LVAGTAGFEVFSPSQSGFSASLVGVACAGLKELTCGGGATDPVLLTAAELAKKLGTPELVCGGDGDAAVLNATEVAKKLGTPDPDVPSGVVEGGLFNTSEFAKKLGMPDAAAGASTDVTFGVSGVAAVSVIDGVSGVSEGGADCANAEDSGLSAWLGSFDGGGEVTVLIDPFVVLGLVKENGSEDMGGSFAVVRSCWICGTCEIK
jgi:hypothetical protein